MIVCGLGALAILPIVVGPIVSLMVLFLGFVEILRTLCGSRDSKGIRNSLKTLAALQVEDVLYDAKALHSNLRLERGLTFLFSSEMAVIQDSNLETFCASTRSITI